MTSAVESQLPARAGRRGRLALRLYIAGSSPNSLQALANLKEIIAQHLPDGCQLEVVDVLIDPQRAMRDQILVTPTLLKLSPAPPAEVVGDLGKRAQVLLALGL